MRKAISLWLLGIVFFATFPNLCAQDIITLKNGDDIQAKVTEISATEIKYKRFNHLDGPTITLAKGDVFAIKYENGSREVMGAENRQSASNAQSSGAATKSPATVSAPLQSSGETATIVFYRKNRNIPLILKTLVVSLHKKNPEQKVTSLMNAQYCKYTTAELGEWEITASVKKESKPVKIRLEAGKTYYISCQAKDDAFFKYGASIEIVDEQRALSEIQELTEAGMN